MLLELPVFGGRLALARALAHTRPCAHVHPEIPRPREQEKYIDIA